MVENLAQESERAAEKLLQIERLYWEQFLSGLMPRGTTPPRVILLPENNKARAFVVDDDVFCTTLLARILSFEELKAVMAHELWHIIKRHYTRTFLWKRAGEILDVLLFATLFLIAFFSQKLGHLVFIAGVLFSLKHLLRFFYYWHSRRQEYFADKYAVSVADPNMLARALVKLRKTNKVPRVRWWKEFFETHPRHAKRLRYLRRWRDEKRKTGAMS